MISSLLALLVAGSAAAVTFPGVQPQLTAVNNDVYLTFGRGDRLAVARSTDGDVVVFRSTDQGVTWTAPVVINDIPGAAREGLHAMAAGPSGLVALAWLDLREGGTRLYTAVSRDRMTA